MEGYKETGMDEFDIFPISITRFNALGGYARQPMTLLYLDEMGHFEIEGGAVIGILGKDITDGDYGGVVMARDRNLRFRGTTVTHFDVSLEKAKEKLFSAMREAALASSEEHYQGDEKGNPVDFFTHVHPPSQLNPSFVQLTTSEGYSPARSIIEPMMRWHEDADGNFIEQFQTTGFDQRIWELYLFAMLIEAGYLLDRDHNVPDFCCSGLLGELFVEAVTVGPTKNNGKIEPPPSIDTQEELQAYLHEYMPIKFGSPLYSKLNKEYWKHSHVAGKPLVLAVADFSSPMSMVHSQPALERYLWGFEHKAEFDANGNLTIIATRVETHQWGEKKPIPSGFFRQPGSEHISAVISSNAGTIAKFNRMGVLTKFGSDRVLLVREGRMVDHDPNAALAKFFRVLVNSAGYEESWIEGLNVYHNPNAATPIAMELLPGAAHHFCDENGQVTSHTPEFHPMSSITKHQFPVDVPAILAEVGNKTHMVWRIKPEKLESRKRDMSAT